MSVRVLVQRPAAIADSEEAIAYYLAEGGESVAFGFIDALEQAFRHVERHPETGSTRWAHELGLRGIRSWSLRRHPYLVFYRLGEDGSIDVWRVLHTRRDPGGLLGAEDPIG